LIRPVHEEVPANAYAYEEASSARARLPSERLSRFHPVFTRWLPLREPFNGISHFVGALLSLFALAVLLEHSRGDGSKLVSFSVYGGSLFLVYLASATYHSIPSGPVLRETLRRLDQCSIYLLIAGTYTPVCVLRIEQPLGWVMLLIVWTIALVGILIQSLWKGMPIWLNVALYLCMGWMSVAAMGSISRALSPTALQLLVAGGAIYTVGCVIFALERPDPWPRVFGFHEIWHLFVLAASGAHFAMMLTIV